MNEDNQYFFQLVKGVQYAQELYEKCLQKDNSIKVLMQKESKLNAELVSLKARHKTTCEENKEYQLLLERYMKDAQQHYEICPMCGGDAGHEFDTEDGPNHEECDFCEATGVVTREIFQKWKESQAPKNTVKEVAIIKSNDSDDLPF